MLNDKELSTLLSYLCDLSLDADTFEIAAAALRLQSLIKEQYGIV